LPFVLNHLVTALLCECSSLAAVDLWQTAEGERALLDDTIITA
jgi:hypothetical protein